MKSLNYLLCLLMVSVSMACKDSKSDDGPTNSPLSAAEHKVKLEQIGKDFVSKIKAEDHKTVINSLNQLSEYLDGSNFDIYFPEYLNSTQPFALSSMVAALEKTIRKNDMGALTKAATMVDKYSWKDFTGKYTYAGAQEWSKTEVADKLEFYYDNAVIAITYSGNRTYDKVDGIEVEFPEEVKMVMTVDGAEQLAFTTKFAMEANQLAAVMTSELKLASDYIWKVAIDARGNNIKVDGNMTVKGEKLMDTHVEMRGVNMTDPDYLGKHEEEMENVFQSADFTFTLMNVKLVGKGNITTIGEELSQIHEESDKIRTEKQAAVFNKNTKFEAYYVAENQKIADVIVQSYLADEYSYGDYHYEEWDFQSYLVFSSDNSSVELDSFFSESGFNGLLDAVEVLLNKYSDMLGGGRVEF